MSELATDPVTMKCCNEVFCRICIDKALEHSSLCPICRVAVKEVKGNQPPGTMSRYNSHVSLPGYEGAGTIVIKYSIPSGTQTTEHPNPGTLTVLNVILIIYMYRSAISWNNT